MKQITWPIASVMMTAVVSAEEFPRLDEALPLYVNIQGQEPLFDFDTDGCYPASGISRNGKMNSGLKNSGALNGSCRDAGFLDISNTLHRYACIDSHGARYCGHFYALYFEKDQVSSGWDLFGHRHDWEHVAIWTKNGVITHASYSAHGQLNTKSATELSKEGSHIKFVYHKDGPSTHAFRFAKQGEVAENHYVRWVIPTITSWYQLSGDGISNQDMRTRLNTFDYGSAHVPLKDNNFQNNINSSKPIGFPDFTKESIDLSH